MNPRTVPRRGETAEVHASRSNPRAVFADKPQEFIQACQGFFNGRTIQEFAIVQKPMMSQNEKEHLQRYDTWWDCAMVSYGNGRDFHDMMADGRTVCGKQMGSTFDRQISPFGARVSCKPIAYKGEERLHQLGKRNDGGYLRGLVLRAERGWSGDLLVADCEALKDLSTSEIHVQRCKHQEISVKECQYSLC